MTNLEIARLFHDTYERLAPQFGYETRPETRAFDPESPNGQLMIAVVSQVLDAYDAACTSRVEPSAKPGYQVHVQRNVIGLHAGLEYPKSCEHVPFGPVYDTRDAAMLSVKGNGWMDLWWHVEQVNRTGDST